MNRDGLRDAAVLGLLAFAFTPVTILLHELGHLAIAFASGLPAELHPASVSGGAHVGSGQPSALIALQAAGGPLVTVAMSLAAGLLYVRNPGRRWALAFAVAAASRLFVAAAWLVLRLVLLVLGRPYGGTPNFDEHNAARALGWPPEIAAMAATLFAVGLVAWLARHLTRGRRIAALAAMAAGIVAANVLWPMVAPGVLLRLG
ncbi:MAG TPA: hypothetical protein VIT45_05985 [Allosphingosinicella sp.]